MIRLWGCKQESYAFTSFSVQSGCHLSLEKPVHPSQNPAKSFRPMTTSFNKLKLKHVKHNICNSYCTYYFFKLYVNNHTSKADVYVVYMYVKRIPQRLHL